MSIYDTLNAEQKEAVLHTEGPLLILAGAGSGKTRVLTHRIAYLIEEKGVNPWNILAITFTNKAAGEMRERVDKIVGFGSESIWVSTFHSMCVRILRRYIDRLVYDTNFTIYDTDDQKTLMKDVCKMLQIDTKIYKERMFLSEISSSKDELVTPEEYELNAAGDYVKGKVAQVYKEYEKQLKANNALDFDDLLLKTVQLFQTQVDVLDYYQERFRYIMVDEYQDTNTVQFQLIRLLAQKYKNLCVVGDDDQSIYNYYQERFRYIMVDEYQDTNTVQFQLIRLLAQKYKNLCVVGDDDQSIYKFRGANIQNILSFEKVFEDARVIKLEQNYRSTANILNAANAVIRHNTGRKDKTIQNILSFEKVFEDARVIKLEQNYRSTANILNAANAVIRHNTGRKDKTLWTDNDEGEKIGFRQFDTAFDEAEYIVDDIRKGCANKGFTYSDYAVLYRTNAQSRMFEEKFVTANIPYKIVGGVNFYARREIKDLLSYLKTIDNGKDDLAVRRIINVPKRSIGLTTVNRVQENASRREIKDLLSYLKTIDNGKDDLAVRRIINVPKRSIGLTTVNRVQENALERGISFYDALRSADLIGNIGRSLPKIDSFVALIEHFKEQAEKISLSQLMEEIIEMTGYIDSLEAENEIEAQTRIENIEELKNKIVAYEESCED